MQPGTSPGTATLDHPSAGSSPPSSGPAPDPGQASDPGAVGGVPLERLEAQICELAGTPSSLTGTASASTWTTPSTSASPTPRTRPAAATAKTSANTHNQTSKMTTAPRRLRPGGPEPETTS